MAKWADKYAQPKEPRYRIVDVENGQTQLRYYYKGQKRKDCKYDSFEEALQGLHRAVYGCGHSDVGRLQLQCAGKTIAELVKCKDPENWEFYRVRFSNLTVDQTRIIIGLVRDEKLHFYNMFEGPRYGRK